MAESAKTVLITGGNRGIGQEVARVLATQNWDVLVGSRDRAKGCSAVARLRKTTAGRLKVVELDVTSDASVATAVEKLRDGLGKRFHADRSTVGAEDRRERRHDEACDGAEIPHNLRGTVMRQLAEECLEHPADQRKRSVVPLRARLEDGNRGLA